MNVIWRVSCEGGRTLGTSVGPRLDSRDRGGIVLLEVVHFGSSQMNFEFSDIPDFSRHLSHVGLP